MAAVPFRKSTSGNGRRVAPAHNASGAARRQAERHGRFQWGHVIARTRGQPAGLRPTKARLSLLAGASERASERAHSHGRPLYHFRYRVARLTVHRSRRLLNPTLFARCITYFVIAHFVPR